MENALLTRKRQPPQRGVHSGENRVFRLNATFGFHKKSKVICSKVRLRLSLLSSSARRHSRQRLPFCGRAARLLTGQACGCA
ncbi:hypothetical protein [Desulfovibrio sp. ZJ200]|uniref:hypothetical protein n=1 Tax=Desulfovibrio sp. ZJ200 TaxID=2709792 RepID=UPI0013EC1B4E|nr:hypothetical protein [Desulfovibrio sp. ZJ200]